jgi:suppressor for copper-sensitivity B
MALTLRNIMTILVLALSAAASGGTRAAEAAASPWVRTDHTELRLIAAPVGQPRGELRLGLEFQIKPGWHIYWRSPGDAGLPPRVDWAGSENVTAPAIAWPLPRRYTIFGLTTFVYGDDVVLPMAARVPDPGAPVRLRAKVSYLVCEKICIPYDATLALDLPPTAAAGPATGDDEAARRIDAFLARVPGRVAAGDPDATLSVTRAALVSDRAGLWLEVLARSAQALNAPEIMVEGPPALRFGAPQIERAADGMSALFRLPAAVVGQGGAVPSNPKLVVTLADIPPNRSARAVEQAVTADSRAAADAGAGLGVILALALLGGIILNLMPCVLPVLSLKLLSVMNRGGAAAPRAANLKTGGSAADATREVRRGFIATAAGIVFSFWLLAGGALAFKAAGLAVGWGIQFQSPLFLGLMAGILILFAANLFGLFDIPLPGFAARVAERAPAENAVDGRGSLAGAFATGAFATLLATPCSAPFLGTAVGFALTRGTLEILSVFTALGVGLAAPYLVVAAFPALARHLPRPGPWMRTLRVVLGVALLATAAWIATVIWVVAGAVAAVAGALVLVVLLALLALRGRSTRLAGAPGFAVLAVIFAAGVLAPAVLAGAGGPVTAAEAGRWRPFDKVVLYNLVAEGHVVFVDVTADWCITCKANKAAVIDRGRVAAALGDGGSVVPMRADWTRPDPAIASYLRSFGRFGIPFNAVYGPAAPQGIPLPELLTERTVMDAVAAAAPSAANLKKGGSAAARGSAPDK